jgi:hypothetical protein
LTEICQRAVKLAIRESIEKDIQRRKLREEEGVAEGMEDVVEEDPVPYITPAHFELAMRDVRLVPTTVLPLCVLHVSCMHDFGGCGPTLWAPCPLGHSLPLVLAWCAGIVATCTPQARRSVSDADMAKYSSFAASMQQSRANLGGGMGAANFRFPTAGGGSAGAAAAGGADEEDLYS